MFPLRSASRPLISAWRNNTPPPRNQTGTSPNYPNRLRDVLSDVDVIFHFAATVGVGQSMYEISRYMSVNTQGTAELLQAMLDSKATIEKIVVASSMSIYGEGRYVCSVCSRPSAPPLPHRLKSRG